VLEASILVISDERLSAMETKKSIQRWINLTLTDPTIAHELMEEGEVPG